MKTTRGRSQPNGQPALILRVTPDGRIYGVTEDFPLADIGETEIRRLSQIEWDRFIQKWSVFSLIDRKIIGSFKRRRDALEFERKYMARRWRMVRAMSGVR